MNAVEPMDESAMLPMTQPTVEPMDESGMLPRTEISKPLPPPLPKRPPQPGSSAVI